VIKEDKIDIGSEYEFLSGPFHEFIESLTSVIDGRDEFTKNHSHRVAELSGNLARWMGYPEEFAVKVHIAGHLHDIGKIIIHESIRLKPEKLDIKEFTEIKQHPVTGAEIIAKVRGLESIVNMVLHHHERWIGMGYPEGISGDDIDPGGRIIAVADSLDALLTTRPYSPAMSMDSAFSEINSFSGRMYDPRVVEALMSIDRREIKKLYPNL
jgi:putative nucleotidyltransferase with HDIG domain